MIDRPFSSPTHAQSIHVQLELPLPELTSNTCRFCKRRFDRQHTIKHTEEELIAFREWLTIPSDTEIIVCDNCWPQMFSDHRAIFDLGRQYTNLDPTEIPLLTLRK
jgi:hypothetical protein